MLDSFKLVITVTPEEINDQNLFEQVLALNLQAPGITDLKELGDCRNLKYADNLSVNGTTQAAASEIDRPESLLALLIHDDKLIYGLVRAYQAFAEDRRKSVKIFTKIEEALYWLELSCEAKDKVREMLKGVSTAGI